MDIGMAVERRSAMATRKWFRRLVLLMVAAIGAGLSWGGWRFWEVQQYQQAIEEIEQQIAAGRNGLAAKNLVSLLAWKPGLVEAIYLLGVCERARGRTEEASEAWARVPPDSPLWGQAILRRAELQIERGQLADAEQLIKLTQESAPERGSILSVVLVPMYCQQGRFEEAGRLIQAQWDQLNETGEGASEQAINFASVVHGHSAEDRPHRSSPRVSRTRRATGSRGRSRVARKSGPGDSRWFVR